MSNDPKSDASAFQSRRAIARERLDRLVGAADTSDTYQRRTWFEAVYETAENDPAAVPWADLMPKPELVAWLAEHPGTGRSAIDIACGLGDNAEAIAKAGYKTTAFDLAEGAIRWARERFPQSNVDYRTADLFALPAEWRQGFDLVHEYYTVQALQGEMRRAAPAAIADLVAPGGRLLVFARSRDDGSDAAGPPWPLTPSEIDLFTDGTGLVDVSRTVFDVVKSGRVIPHIGAVFRRA